MKVAFIYKELLAGGNYTFAAFTPDFSECSQFQWEIPSISIRFLLSSLTSSVWVISISSQTVQESDSKNEQFPFEVPLNSFPGGGKMSKRRIKGFIRIYSHPEQVCKKPQKLCNWKWKRRKSSGHYRLPQIHLRIACFSDSPVTLFSRKSGRKNK